MRAAFYKGTRPGIQGIYNRLVRAWTRGPYSHVELVFFDGYSASSSFLDGGVRFKKIDFDPEHWDFVEIPNGEIKARNWFIRHEGQKYDVLGIAHLVVGFIGQAQNKWYCSEAVAEALGIQDSWRFEPNVLASLLRGRE